VDTIKSNTDRYRISIIGGATMINTSTLDIAGMNIAAIKSVMEELKLRPRFMELGGNKGYEVLCDCKDGTLYLRRFGEEYKEVL
jgi:chemotaxis receptor (MCP) glutamine deamidase CheD